MLNPNMTSILPENKYLAEIFSNPEGKNAKPFLKIRDFGSKKKSYFPKEIKHMEGDGT